MGLPYGRMVKAAAILQLIEEEGVTPEMIEKWGDSMKKKESCIWSLKQKILREGEMAVSSLKSREVLDYTSLLSEL